MNVVVTILLILLGMEAVRAQKEDLPYDSEDPLFSFGHGLSYEE